MNAKHGEVRTSGAAGWLTGGGVMGELIREMDWAETPLGPIESWPQSLRTSILLTLNSRYPMVLMWGRELTNIYNDAYIPMLGARHPEALGRPASRVWAEIWDVIGPQTEIVMREGRATSSEFVPLALERSGHTEETSFTFSYSPAFCEDGDVGGVVCVCAENAGARAYEEERRRAEALAELDRASTAFFSFREMIDTLPAAIYTTDAKGKIVGDINMLLDITERKRREQATALLSAIVDSSDDAIVSKDLNGVITSWNKSAERMFGYTAQEMIGQPCAVMIPEDRSHEESQIIEKLRRGERIEQFETVRVRKDGSRLDVSLTFSPVRDAEGRVIGASKIARDITEPKRAEEKLAAALQRLQAHVNNSPLAVIEFDPDFRVTAWSEGAERMFGWSASETVGKLGKDLPWAYEADAEGIDAICAEMLVGSRSRYNYVNRNYRKDGSVIECEWYNSVLRDANGKTVSINSQVFDITERKRAEESLRESEQRYRALTELSPQIVFTSRPDGHVSYVNQHAQEYAGRTLAELQGDGWADFIHPEYRERIINIWRTATQEVSEYEEEVPFRRHDGAYRRFYTRALPIMDNAGAVAYWIGTAVDVEDLKRAEDELRKSEERFRTITDNTQSCLWMIDTQGRCTFANPASERVSGFKPEELIGQALHQMVHHTRPDGTPFPIEECPLYGALPLKEAVVGYEDIFVHKDGHFYPVRCAFRPIIVNGEPIGSVVEVQDITEERRAAAERERLLEKERRHGRNLQRLNAASVAINAATSVEEVVRLVCEEARQLTGARMAVVNLIQAGGWKRARSVASLSGEYAAWDDYKAQITGEGIYSLIAREKRTMRMTQAELESHPAWRCFSAEACNHPPLRGWLAAPLLDGGGEFIGVVQLSDKWADKRVGGRLGEFTEADEALLWQLAQVASVALDKQRLYEQEQEARQLAEQATRAKDEFLAVVSHELRSPLNAILGWNRLLRSQRGDDRQIARVTETVERSGKAQLQLIEDLLDTARIISGKMRLEARPVDLVVVITSALDVIGPAAASKGIVIIPNFNSPNLDSEAGQTSDQIIGDPDRLQQVVWNLVSNAIRFTPEGGRVWVELRRGGPGVQIIVRDTGQGISLDLLPYVFDRFKQGDSSVSRRFGGLGLGLALVKHLVELHGGSVTVESQGAGQGATFTVDLPVRAVKGDSVAERQREVEMTIDHRPPRMSQMARLEGLRALVVEDEAVARELITLTLEHCGALVTGVDSAASALAALESRLEDPTAYAPFDVLISDIGMPGEDGYELIRRVRTHADKRVNGVRAVALTAYARAEDRLQALRAGFHMHVPKPVDEVELTTVIAALTGRTPSH